MNKPRLLLSVKAMTMMRAKVIMPPPPTPMSTLPSTKTANEFACDATMAPMEKKNDESNRTTPGEKIMASRPIMGEIDAVVMRYELLNHMADS